MYFNTNLRGMVLVIIAILLFGCKKEEEKEVIINYPVPDIISSSKELILSDSDHPSLSGMSYYSQYISDITLNSHGELVIAWIVSVVGSNYYWISNYNTMGEKQSVSVFERNLQSDGMSLRRTENGDLFYSGRISQQNTGCDVLVGKLDSLGNLIWEKQIVGNLSDELTSINVDSSGNLFVVGITYGEIDGNSQLGNDGDPDIFLIKFDAGGNLTWSKQIGSVKSDYSNKLVISENDSIYLSGHTYGNYGGCDPAVNNYCGFVTKFNSDGMAQWTLLLKDRSITNLTADTSGNFYITSGNSNSEDYLRKYNSSAVLEWNRQFNTFKTNPNEIICHDDALIIAGIVSGNLDNLETLNTLYNIYVRKYDSSGNIVWTCHYGEVDYISSMTITDDRKGQFYVTFSGRYQESKDMNKYGTYLMKLDSSGNQIDLN